MTRVWVVYNGESVVSLHKTAQGALHTARALFNEAIEHAPCRPYAEGETEFFQPNSMTTLGRVYCYAVLE